MKKILSFGLFFSIVFVSLGLTTAYGQISKTNQQVVTIYGKQFPTSHNYRGGGPLYEEDAPVIEAQSRERIITNKGILDVFELIAAEGNYSRRACCLAGDPNGYYGWLEDVIFVGGKYVTRGNDLSVSWGDEYFLVVSAVEDWVGVFDYSAKCLKTIRKKTEYRLHARFLEDGKRIFYWSSGWGKIFDTRSGLDFAPEYDVPSAIISQGGLGEQKNASIKEFVHEEGVMYRAFFDPNSHILTFGHTLSGEWPDGFREGLRVSTIETLNVKTGKHEICFPKFLIKTNWIVKDGAIFWWSPSAVGNDVNWTEYKNGAPTGRSFVTHNHLWPQIKDDVAVIPVMQGDKLSSTKEIKLN